MTLKRVLVPLDGSGFGERALPLAVDVARRSGARLGLISVASPAAVAPGEGQRASTARVHQWNQRLVRYLGEVAARITREASVEIDAIVVDGDPVSVIGEHADRLDADLIVMTTHGAGPISRMWLGSVADGLLRRTNHTLLLIRPTASVVDLGAPTLPRRVVLPLDGSPLSEEIIDPALELVALWGAELRLLRVVRPGVLDTEPELEQRQRAASDYLLDVWATRLTAHRRRSWSTRAVIHRDVAGWLLKYGKSTQDLIAISTRGHEGLDRLLLGSVADKVIRGATGPVLVRRPKS